MGLSYSVEADDTPEAVCEIALRPVIFLAAVGISLGQDLARPFPSISHRGTSVHADSPIGICKLLLISGGQMGPACWRGVIEAWMVVTPKRLWGMDVWLERIRGLVVLPAEDCYSGSLSLATL